MDLRLQHPKLRFSLEPLLIDRFMQQCLDLPEHLVVCALHLCKLVRFCDDGDLLESALVVPDRLYQFSDRAHDCSLYNAQ